MKLIKTILLVAFAITMALPFGMGKARVRQERRQGLHILPSARENEGTHACGAILQGPQPFLGRLQGAGKQLSWNACGREG